MGFFSKIWKGIKKTFKKIFKPIKKVFKSIGKFMGKIGIAGQIAMMFLPIPGLGSLFSGLGKAGSSALGWLTKQGAVGSAAASVIGSAAKFVGAIAKPFVNISKGVTGFVKDFTKYTLNKIPGINIASAPTNIFGKGGAWSQASEAITTSFNGFKGDIASAASMDISDILPKATSAPAINLTEATDKIASDRIPGSNYSALEMPTEAVNIPETTLDSTAVSEEIVQETVSKETKGFFGDMKDKMLAPYKEFAGDPLGTIGDKATGFVANQLDPMSLLMKPDDPKAPKYFEPMRISPYLASSKYDAITAQQAQMPVFMQQGFNMGLFQGGYDPLPLPEMGYGGVAFSETLKRLTPA